MILKRILYLLLELLMLAIWIPVGLFLWVPFLIRAVGAFMGMFLVASLTSSGSLENAEYQLNRAVSFWADGFTRIHNSLDITRESTEPPPASEGSGCGALINVIFQVALAAVIWYFTLRFFSTFIPSLQGIVDSINDTVVDLWEAVAAFLG